MRGVATDRIYQGFPGRGGVFLTGIFDLFSDYCNMFTGRLCEQLERDSSESESLRYCSVSTVVHSPAWGFGRAESDGGPSDNFVEGALAVASPPGVNYRTSAKKITGLIPPSNPQPVTVNNGEWSEHTWHHLSMRRYCSPACDRHHYRRCRCTPYCQDCTMNSRAMDSCHSLCDLCSPRY